jgi:hypothetical protein
MIDTEVMRLRGLRNTALRARAIAAALNLGSAHRNSVFSRGALSCWRIARVITGWLRAHPYLSYQQGPSEVRGLYDRISADLLGRVARYRGGSLHIFIFADELRRVAREVDDARALTWSSELSDSLGRFQAQIRDLIKELDACTSDVGARPETAPRIAAHTAAPLRRDSARQHADGVAGVWPYLAI